MASPPLSSRRCSTCAAEIVPGRVCSALLVLLILPCTSTVTCQPACAATRPSWSCLASTPVRRQHGVWQRIRVKGRVERGPSHILCANLHSAQPLAEWGGSEMVALVPDDCGTALLLHCNVQCCHLEPSTGALRLKGGGRIARERMGILTPKKWEQNKVRGGGGVFKKARNVAVPDSDKTQKMSKEDKEKLRARKQSYKELIQRSKKKRDDRKRTKMNADALREEMDAGSRFVCLHVCAFCAGLALI